MVYHKEQLLSLRDRQTVGSSAVWFEPPPPEAAQPGNPRKDMYLMVRRLAPLAVGLGDLPTREPVLLIDEEQDEDRRKFQYHEDREDL